MKCRKSLQSNLPESTWWRFWGDCRTRVHFYLIIMLWDHMRSQAHAPTQCKLTPSSSRHVFALRTKTQSILSLWAKIVHLQPQLQRLGVRRNPLRRRKARMRWENRLEHRLPKGRKKVPCTKEQLRAKEARLWLKLRQPLAPLLLKLPRVHLKA